jgi:hypothetical protein
MKNNATDLSSLTLIFSTITIIVFSFFIFQAIKNGLASIQLLNVNYFLQDLSLSNSKQIKEKLTKAQNSLDKIQFLFPKETYYYHLQAKIDRWQVWISGNLTKNNNQKVKYWYQLALLTQPNNSFLWLGLAKTDLAYIKTIDSLLSIKQANYYAPSDHLIQTHTVLWVMPLWQQLTSVQQQILIMQIRLLAKKNKFKPIALRLKALIKQVSYQIIICAQLPRTKNVQWMCHD